MKNPIQRSRHGHNNLYFQFIDMDFMIFLSFTPHNTVNDLLIFFELFIEFINVLL